MKYSSVLLLVTLSLAGILAFQGCATTRKHGDRQPLDHHVSKQTVHSHQPNYKKANKHYRKAQKLAAKGKFQEATLEYHNAIAHYPEFAEAINDLAVEYIRRNDLDLASVKLNRALSINPAFTTARNNLAYVHFLWGSRALDQKKHTDAIAHYKDAISIKSDYTDAYNDIGVAYLRINNYEEALNYFDLALIINPNHINANENKAFAYFSRGREQGEKGNLTGAIEDLSQAITINPKPAQYYNQLADLLWRNGEQEKAMIYLDKAISIDRYNDITTDTAARLWTNRGDIRLGEGRIHDAIADYMNAICINPIYAHSYTRLAEIYRQIDKLELAASFEIQASQAAVNASRRNLAKPHYVDAHAEMKNGNMAKAIAHLDNTISVFPDYFEAYNDRGHIYTQMRKHKLAMRDFERALEINPNYELARRNKANIEHWRKERASLILAAILSTAQAVSGTLDAFQENNPPVIPVSRPPGKPDSHLKYVICRSCNGTGVRSAPSYGPSFGLDQSSEKQCPICMKFENHYHEKCIPCKGSGYIQQVQY